MASYAIARRQLPRLALGAAALGLAGRSGVAEAAQAVLTLYSAQHAQTVALITKRFTKETGVRVRVHKGDAPEIASQIALEGAHSPADVYFTENSPELFLLDEKKLLAPVDPATLAQVPRKYSAPNGNWVGVLARENVLAFNPKMIATDALPGRLFELGEPKWKGKIAIAPGDADFLPLVGAVVALEGQAKALAWLKDMRRNAQIFDDDEGVVAAVNRGAVATGIINNYYWARLWAELGSERIKCQIHHFAPGDVGALINISGAAVLKSSKHPKEAQRFLAFLVSLPVQEMLGKSDVDFEYPLVPGVAANPILKPFDKLRPPPISVTELGDDRLAVALVREAGLI